MREPEETVVDVLVVGAGGAGMAAALAAADQGLQTLLVEKSPWFGGSTARSGGGVWIPGNHALHADPGFADGAGFPAPILSGLCSYGIVLREVLQGLLGSDVSRVAGFSARFAGVVFPGETVRTTAWQLGDRLLVRATIAAEGSERDGAPVLADAVVDLRS